MKPNLSFEGVNASVAGFLTLRAIICCVEPKREQNARQINRADTHKFEPLRHPAAAFRKKQQRGHAASAWLSVAPFGVNASGLIAFQIRSAYGLQSSILNSTAVFASLARK